MSLRLVGNRTGQLLIPSAVGVVAAGLGSAGQYGAIRKFGGTITTVRCFEDNALAKAVLEEDGNGRVLVVDGGGSLHTALMGDMIARIAMTNGWAGVVINGDRHRHRLLAELPIGIKALGSNPRKSAKTGAGERDVAVEFRGAMFPLGATLYTDDGGIVVMASS
jgi:regulator of ribonuclease activity A